MKLLAIYVGRPKDTIWNGNSVSTGIFKKPVLGTVKVGTLNLEGDEQADLTVHGGRDKAVYAYSFDAYPWWEKRLGKKLDPSAFGENLVVDTLSESDLCVGDIVEIGTCQLQVVQPRFPCFKLGIKFSDMGIIKTFMESGRPGVYFRVLREGDIKPGEDLIITARDPQKVSILDLFEMKRSRRYTPDLIKRLLNITDLNPDWREIGDRLK